MSIAFALNIVIGLLNGATVAALIRFVPRFWRQMPWLVMLTVYFAVRAAKRVVNVANDDVATGMDLALDWLLLPVLVLLVLNTDRMIRGFRAAHDEAEFRQKEYERARLDYEQLVRHRLMNPVAVIKAAAITLRAGVVEPPMQTQLLEAMEQAATAIEHTTLEPERRGIEEGSLDAVPRTADAEIASS